MARVDGTTGPPRPDGATSSVPDGTMGGSFKLLRA